MDIRSDRQKVLSYTEIARKYNIDPRTAKKYAQSETRPVYSLSAAKPSKLDPYKGQIAIWLEEAPYSAERILEKIREQGFDGGRGSPGPGTPEAAGVCVDVIRSHGGRLPIFGGCLGLQSMAVAFGGVLIGRAAGKHLGRWAEMAGGVVLIGLGAKILLEHTLWCDAATCSPDDPEPRPDRR